MKKMINKVGKLYDNLIEEENGRHNSWEYCYKAYHDSFDKELTNELSDYLCINLAFYLASWGMYRGSSFLLQKDYKVHKNIVKILLEKKYKSLRGIKVSEYYNKENIELLEDIIDRLREEYSKIRNSVKKTTSSISDTLISKVLLGTLGCVPAYDRYFIAGIKEKKVTQSLGSKSILELADLYKEQFEDFESIRDKMKIGKIKYPQMKVIDMCFWQLGYDLDSSNSK